MHKDQTATLQRNLYDSYIRAIRWGSDRLGDAGVMAYVSGQRMDRARLRRRDAQVPCRGIL